MDCTDTVLSLGTDKPGKLPQKFVIQSLTLRTIGAGQPMDFTAMLTNPKPVGQIESRGYFGPWNAAQPGATAVGGTYSFHDADLGTIKGIGGILSSAGGYQGTLDKIVVDGKTDTPDFQVKISGHKVPLHTEFHAIVDGTDGNTYLQPVKAQFLHSFLTARGYVVRDQGEPGRHVYLDVDMDQARIEDLLRLARAHRSAGHGGPGQAAHQAGSAARTAGCCPQAAAARQLRHRQRALQQRKNPESH